MPIADNSCRMRPRTASASALPAGWGRSSPRMRARLASARAAENWAGGVPGPKASGRQGVNTLSSQIPAASAARLIMRPIPAHSMKPQSYLDFWRNTPILQRRKSRPPSGPPAMGARCRAPSQERATTSVTSSGAEAGVIEVIETSELSPPPTEKSAADGFADLGLAPDILKAVADAGYSTPTPIQAQGIP